MEDDGKRPMPAVSVVFVRHVPLTESIAVKHAAYQRESSADGGRRDGKRPMPADVSVVFVRHVPLAESIAVRPAAYRHESSADGRRRDGKRPIPAAAASVVFVRHVPRYVVKPATCIPIVNRLGV